MMVPVMSHIRNITRFTYEFTSFQGWRVTLCRRQYHFTRYFSDRQYGGEEQALSAALKVRDKLLRHLRQFPDDPLQAFDLCRGELEESCYPVGLRPRKGTRG